MPAQPARARYFLRVAVPFESAFFPPLASFMPFSWWLTVSSR